MRDGRWHYTIKGYAGSRHPKAPAGVLLVETTHVGEHSRDMEIEAWRARLRRGEASRIEVISHIEPFGVETIYE